MARLQQRPVLFKYFRLHVVFIIIISFFFFLRYVIDEYCISRRAVLVGEFIDALTRGGPSGNPAPIEMRAHDPHVYVTDILVWLNKAIPIEWQNLQLLVRLCNKEGKNFIQKRDI